MTPQWTGRPFEHIDLDGALMPMYQGQPVIVETPGCADLFVIVFSTKEKLDEYIDAAHLPYNKVKEVTDSREFCETLWAQKVRIMLDPHIVEGNRTRWKEVVQEGTENKLMAGHN